MSLGLSLNIGQKLEIKISQSIDFPKVVEDIKEHFKDNESGDVRNLKELLKTIPQRQNGKLAYVIGGGWAVEVLTGKARDHGNINVLVVDPRRTTLESNRCLDYLGVQYLDDSLERALVKKDIIKGDWKRGKQNVYVPSREFMIGTKMLPRTAQEGNRDKDIEDIVQLLAVKPDMKKLAKVFNSLPYIRNGKSVASVIYGVAGLSPKENILRCLNSALREQLGAYEEKQRISREVEEAGDILNVSLSSYDYKTLRKYHEREASDVEFSEWLSDNSSKLVNRHGRIYHPCHPDKEPVSFDLDDLDNALSNQVIDRGAFEVILRDSLEHPGSSFSVRSVVNEEGHSLSVWNPKGKLIYENWRKE